MITIGTNSFGYPQQRNFVGLPFDDIVFKKSIDFYKILSYLNYKLLGKVVPKYINNFDDKGLNKVDMYHFFNTITPVKKPWVVTFETSLPRMDPDYRKGYDYMAGKYCKRLIPFSQRAYDAQLYHLNRYPEYKEVILNKMSVIQPAQKVLLTDFSEKNFNTENVVFTFTGSAFYGKGGLEVLKAFNVAKEKGWPVKLNIISKMEKQGYMDEFITPEMMEQSMKIIGSNPLITHYSFLPNKKVLEILRESHVVLLPSYGETYGYSLLEGMAMGCMPITTDLSPFPEFVNEEWGGIITIDKYMHGPIQRSYNDIESYKRNSDKIVNGLLSIMEEVLNNRNILREKAQKSLVRIQQNHNPYEKAAQLKSIYLESLL